MRKNATKLAAAVLSLAMVMTSVSVPASAAKTKKAKLNKTKATLYTNGSKSQKSTTLKLTVGGKKVKATFKSSNTKLLTVGKTTGKVTAKKNGTATVTATYKKKAYKCKITVKTYATSVSVKAKTLTLKEGKTATIKTTVKPSTASNKKVSFTSSNKSVATVSSKGKVTAKKAGTAKITVKALGAKKGVKAATVTVKVEKATPAPTETPVVTETPVPTETPSVATEGTISVTTNITGAAVEIYDGPTLVTTGSTMSGYTYTTDKIKYGTYVVIVKKNGYKDFTQTVVLNADDAKVDAKLESVNEVKAELDKAYKVNDTQVQVNFTNKIAVPTASNFSIEGLTIKDVKITDDQKSVILTVDGMKLDKTYTVKTNNIVDANGKAVADGKVDFTARKITYKADMDIVDVKTGKSITEIKSDGKETAKFVVTLKDDAGNVIKDNAEVRFTTTAGNFAETKVAAQSGVATNIFTSEISATQKNALVTATVVASDNKDLINIEATRTLSMNPNVNQDNKGAVLTDVMVETCDRVILYFNKPVNAKDYTVNKPGKTYKYDPDKMEIKIADNAGTYETVEACEAAGKKVYTPMALAPVPDNPNALYAILDTDTDKDQPAKDAKYLTDNAKAIVKITDYTKTVPTTETKSTNVTDICAPSMLSVTNEGLRKIKITFSEPVQNNTKAGAAFDNSAELLKKWVIDQAKLEDPKFGSTEPATATVGKFNVDTCEDNRNVVTITLGKNDYNKPIYFPAGSHSVQGNNIGDWANITDKANNLINTQTLDFVIEADDTAPTATVKAESPEQFDLKFNTPVVLSDLKDYLELQYKKDNEWVRVTDNPINIRPVENTDDKEYIVELTDDWTKILKTDETKKNYYNYNFRLYIKKDVIINVLNGLKNAEIALDLNDKIMKEPDVTSAGLSGVYKDDNTVVIDIDEPVQINLKDIDPNVDDKYRRTLTPKKEQGNKLSQPIVQFISSGDKETIQGHIVSISDHDNQITVVPDKTISTGTWRVVVRNVSDDVGNTSPTLVKNDFIVDKPIVSDDFKVLWVVGVQKGKTVPADVDNVDNEADLVDNAHDVIYVKFNKQIKTFGGTLNAGATTNYTVNGYTLPTTTKIISSVDKYNENAVTKNDYSDIVAIQLKPGTLTDKSNTINISKTLESAAGDQLGNGGLKLLSEYMNTAGVFAWNFEKCDKDVIGKTSATTSDVQSFLDDGKYSAYDLRNVDITDSAKETLTIKHTSNVIFKDNTKVKELNIETQETGVLKISGVTAEKVTINAPNADVVLNNVKVNAAGSTIPGAGTLEVVDILDGTLTLSTGTDIDKLIVKDSNAGAIKLEGGAKVADFVIDTTGTITLEGATDGTTLPNGVTIKKACTLHVKNATTNFTVKIDKTSVDPKNVTITENVNGSVTVKDSTGTAINDFKVKPEVAKWIKLDINKDDAAGVTGSEGKKATATVKITNGASKAGSLKVAIGNLTDSETKTIELDGTKTAKEVAAAIATVEGGFTGYNIEVDDNDKTTLKITASTVGLVEDFGVKIAEANKTDPIGVTAKTLSSYDGENEVTGVPGKVVITPTKDDTIKKMNDATEYASTVDGTYKITINGVTVETDPIKGYETKVSDVVTKIYDAINTEVVKEGSKINGFKVENKTSYVTVEHKTNGGKVEVSYEFVPSK